MKYITEELQDLNEKKTIGSPLRLIVTIPATKYEKRSNSQKGALCNVEPDSLNSVKSGFTFLIFFFHLNIQVFQTRHIFLC